MKIEQQDMSLLPDTFKLDLKNKFQGLLEENLDVDHINQLLCNTIIQIANK